MNETSSAVRLMVRAAPASAAVWVAVLLLAGFPAAAMALPPGMLGGFGFGEGAGSARLAVEGGGIGGRISLVARRLAPTRPWRTAVAAHGGERAGALSAVGVSARACGVVLVESGVRVERLDLPPPGSR